jgi:uncharacterized protein YhjY with autotransporter beta-barrel domain
MISSLQAANFGPSCSNHRIKSPRKAKVVAALLAGLCLGGFAAHAQTIPTTKGGNGGNAEAGATASGGAGGTSSAVGPGVGGSPGEQTHQGGSPSSGGGGGGAGFPAGGAGGDGGNRGGNGNIGGDGGGGGVHGTVVTTTTSNSGTITGGNGVPGSDASNGNAGGGGGGAGGYGAVVSGTGQTYTNSGIITGGNGGNGGGGGNSANTFGGGGGDGGFGVFLNAGNTLMNSGTITGGNGGVGGTGGGGTAGNGAGAAGVIGTGFDLVIDSGTISGGLAGDKITRANAVDFFNGANTLELRDGFNIVGNAVSHSRTANGGDTLALGGSDADPTFDVALINSQDTTKPTRYLGFAQLVKTGTSTWLLTTTDPSYVDHQYNIPVTIEEGTLVVGTTGPDQEETPDDDTSFALGKGNVFLRGGTLRTTSFQTGAPLKINVGGDYTQGPAGTLALGVAGTRGENYDRVQYGGKASLGGTLSVTSLNNFRPVSGNAFVVVRSSSPNSTSTTRSGRFGQIDDFLNNNPKLRRFDIYARNGVALLYLAGRPGPTPPFPGPTPTPPGPTPSPTPTPPGPTPGPTPNPGPPIDIDIPDSLPPIDPEKPLPLSFLLKFLNPTAEQLTSMFEIPFSGANTQRFNLTDRMTQIQRGSTGFVSAVPSAPPPAPTGKEIGKKEVVPPAFVPGPTNRWGVWVNGWGDWVTVDGDNGIKGYNFTTGGVSVGVDYRITDYLALGIFGTYAHTWTRLNPGDVDVNTGRGGLYATYWNHGFYINGAVYAGHNSYDTSRHELTNTLANGSTGGYEVSTFVDTGYDFHFGDLSFGPVFAAQYTTVHVDGFTEQGSFLPLNIHSDSEESWRTDLGVLASYTWHVGNIIVIPSLWTAWEHEYKYSNLPITFSSVQFPGVSATAFGPHEGHDSAIINAGVGTQWTSRIATYVGYQGQLGRDNYNANGVTGTISFSF